MLCEDFCCTICFLPIYNKLRDIERGFSFLCACKIPHFSHNGSIPKRQCSCECQAGENFCCLCLNISRVH